MTVSERRSTVGASCRAGHGVVAVPAPLGDQPLGDAERELERLLDVQPRVARGLVAAAQVGRGQLGGAADALGDVVAGQLDVQAARMGAQRGVHVEEPVHLVDDPVEVPGLDAVGGLLGVAVHRVALPHDEVPRGASTFSTIAGSTVAHPRVRHPADQA